MCFRPVNWLRGLDLNQGPSGYEPDELPDCSTPRSTGRIQGVRISTSSFMGMRRKLVANLSPLLDPVFVSIRTGLRRCLQIRRGEKTRDANERDADTGPSSSTRGSRVARPLYCAHRLRIHPRLVGLIRQYSATSASLTTAR